MSRTHALRESPGSRTTYAARTAVVLAVGEVTGKLATLALVVVSARVLGAAEFGVFALALGTGLLLAAIPQWGFDTVIIRRGATDPDRVDPLVADTLVVRSTVLSIVLIGVGVWIHLTEFVPAERITVVTVVAACLLDTLGDALRSGCIALERQNGVAIALVVQRLLTASLVVATLLSGAGIVSIGPCYLAGSVLGLAVIALVSRRAGVRPRPAIVRRHDIGSLLRENFLNGVNNVVSMAMARLDILLLASLAGGVAVGIYAAAYRLLETALFVSWTITRALMPIIASAHERLWRVRRALQGGLTLLTLVYLPYAIVLWTRGPDLLGLLYGPEFVPGANVPLWWLAPAPLAFGVAYLGSQVLYARHFDLRTLIGSVIGLVVNIVLNIVLIAPLGATGAAIATTTAYGIEGAYQLVLARRLVGGGIRILPLLAPIAAAVSLAALLMLPLPVLVSLTIGLCGFLLVWGFTAALTDPEQLNVVRGAIRNRSI